MKELMIIFAGAIVFGCGENDNQSTEENVDPLTPAESVDEYSGEDITPQVDLDSGSNRRLEVDTISSPESENREDL